MIQTGISEKDQIFFEIDRFKSVATALVEEGCSGEFILTILINHLKTKFKDNPHRELPRGIRLKKIKTENA